MSRKSFIGLIAVVAAMFFVSGCGTVQKKVKEEMAGLKTRVESLESKVEGVEAKQQEVERTTSEHTQAIEEMKAGAEKREVKTNISVKTKSFSSKGRMREIQACLKNAGFYKGKVNGVKTRATRKAIKEFQKTNGLKADGSVGPKTWELLSKYASGGAAPAAGGAEEGATTK